MDDKASLTIPPEFSLVIPVYKNEENLADLFIALSSLAVSLGRKFEVIFVVDGSPDRSFDIIYSEQSALPFRTQLVAHSRNFGSFAAIVSGLSTAQGEYFAVMAADLQEPITLIEEFFRTLKAGEADIVVGSRTTRHDPFISRTLSKRFWRLFRFLVEPGVPRGGVDVFGCTKKVVDVIVNLPESNSSLIGLLYWIGFEKLEVAYDRQERTKGKSSWSLGRKFSYLSDSIFSFTNLPVTAIIAMGTFGTIVSVVLAMAVFFAWLGGSIDAPGYTALILVQLASTASLLLALGLVGTYVWRTYENSKQRPNAIISYRSQG